MKEVLARWNRKPRAEAAKEILPCCGSTAWANQLAARRPIHNEAALLAACDEVWRNLPEPDWVEAFESHPRIGESCAPAARSAGSTSWSHEEQQRVTTSGEDIKFRLAEGNRAYEQRFNRIFIVCATGKSAFEIPDEEQLPPGLYRLAFDTASYHLEHKNEGLYPVVEVTFLVREGESQFHIPLLLSPYGYTTYRGS